MITATLIVLHLLAMHLAAVAITAVADRKLVKSDMPFVIFMAFFWPVTSLIPIFGWVHAKFKSATQ